LSERLHSAGAFARGAAYVGYIYDVYTYVPTHPQSLIAKIISGTSICYQTHTYLFGADQCVINVPKLELICWEIELKLVF
jgi:hypothetical protein